MNPNQAVPPKNAFLIINGAEIVPLRKAVINIGRMDDNDIVLPNAHVSRYHAQLRAAQGYYLLVDLKSTSGISVNGEKINQKALAPGDVISLAGIPIIYGQTSEPRRLGDVVSERSPQRNAKNPTLGVTDSVDLGTVDRYFDLFEGEDDEPPR